MPPALRYIFFGLMLLSTVSFAHTYLYRRLFRDTTSSEGRKRFGRWLMVGLAILLFVGIPAGRFLGGTIGGAMGWAAYIWMGCLLLFTSPLFAVDIIRFLHRRAPRKKAIEPNHERRQFISRGVAAATVLGASSAGAVGVNTALDDPELKKIDVQLTDMPDGLKGFRIVQLSDIHIGPTIKGDFLRSVVARVNALKPDMVAITGDLVDGTVEALGPHVAPLADLKSTYGSFFVTGNHEYYSGADAWIAELTRHGIRVLRNEHVTLEHGGEKIDIVGVDDWRAKGFGKGHQHDPDKACLNRKAERKSIMLAHQPKSIHDAARLQMDLVLSGHTHGGQIWPFNLAVRLVQPYVSGLNKHSDRTWIYVHCGTGFWGPPMRVGVNAEIALLTLS